jgi:MGT family glycosyltransferase
MSRYLFTLWDGAGAIPPVLSVAGALAGRGHDVRVLADPVMQAEVEASGAEFAPWVEAPHNVERRIETDLVADWEAKSPMGGLARARDRLFVGPADRYARDTRAEIERFAPDVVASEMLVIGPQVAAEAAGIPRAVLTTTILPIPLPGRPAFGPGLTPPKGRMGELRDRAIGSMSNRLWNKALPALNRARAEQGLPPLPATMAQHQTAERLLVLSCEAFDYPTPALPPAIRYCGPRLDDPAWVEAWTAPAGDAPLVLVGLSSSFQDHVPLLRNVATALGRLPVRGLITTGPAISPSEIDAPANVTVVETAPHSEVLREAAAVVTHAGHGTAMKSLAAGVPMVAIPIGRDQPDIAARVAHSGAGLRLKPKASAEKIGAAVERVLVEPSFRSAAGRMADAIAAELETDRAVAELEALAADRAKAPA